MNTMKTLPTPNPELQQSAKDALHTAALGWLEIQEKDDGVHANRLLYADALITAALEVAAVTTATVVNDLPLSTAEVHSLTLEILRRMLIHYQATNVFSSKTPIVSC